MSRLNRNLAWFLTGLAMAILAVMAAHDVSAQDNWIRCKHLQSGAIQMFPGMSCPAQWHPV